ncbi:hypothetical protein BJ165DRAFT_1521989 [Panaeolus papilionaceus]|nr:hypothetical protein BJ165DRAFT_1521989 [Panaeolus papilionaceus]
MPQDKEQAESLKAFANELYGKKNFKAAYQKYTEAIKADGTNAIYYANRAATISHPFADSYMNACTDANKAIALDPSYVKGHARLAAGSAGLGKWDSAIEAWKKALALLPQVDTQLSPTERKLKEQFQSELQKAEVASNQRDDGHTISVDDWKKTPWQRAMAEEDKLRVDGIVNSSGWVMLHAYREFSEGVTTMKSLTSRTIDGKQALLGRLDSLISHQWNYARLSECFLVAFYVLFIAAFELNNALAMFEVQKFGAWSKVGPKVVMEEAPKRLRKEGWNSVRPAISTTVRAWFMAGCLAFKMSRQLGAAYEYLFQTVQLLQWGQRLWHDIPTESKGVVFQQTFIRGVQRLKLEVMLGRLMMKENVTYTKKQVADEALAIIEDVEANPPQGEFDPGFVLSFWVYPKAEALATMGWYYMQTAFASTQLEDAMTAFTKSYEYYLQASAILPSDEEFAFQYLHVALEALWFSSQPIEKQLPLFVRLNTVGQAMMRFWMTSPTSEQRNGQLQVLMSYTNQVMSGLSSGKYQKDNIAKPSTIKSKDKWGNASIIYINGLGLWSSAIEAWEKALECFLLDDNVLTSSERQLKEQCQQELQKAQLALIPSSSAPGDPTNHTFKEEDLSKLAWHRAMDEEGQLIAEKKPSSGWVILYAYRDFCRGVETMKGLSTRVENGETVLFAKPDAVIDLSNGILRDTRVFHFDSADWVDKYNKQVMFEAQYYNGWTKAGSKAIMDEAPKRLKRDGWKWLRPALSITIRSWVIAGCMSGKTGQYGPALEYLSQTTELLEWGRRVWHNVSSDDKGAIFDPTFIRGVKRLKLDVMHAQLASKKPCSFSREQLSDEALALISEAEDNPPEPSSQTDPGFLCSFWTYPRAEALGILGWCHVQAALEARSPSAANTEFANACQYYVRASEGVPPDDEKAAQYLYVALETLWWQGKPLKDQIPMLIKLNELTTALKRFWEVSPTSQPRDRQLLMAKGFATRVLVGLSSSEYSPESVVKPRRLKGQDKWAATNTIWVDI